MLAAPLCYRLTELKSIYLADTLHGHIPYTPTLAVSTYVFISHKYRYKPHPGQSFFKAPVYGDQLYIISCICSVLHWGCFLCWFHQLTDSVLLLCGLISGGHGFESLILVIMVTQLHCFPCCPPQGCQIIQKI